mgnify:CR=1 FL=1
MINMDMYQKRKIRAEKNNRNNEKDEKTIKQILTGKWEVMKKHFQILENKGEKQFFFAF